MGEIADWMKDLGVEEESVERAAQVDIAEGGRLELPDVGEKIVVKVLEDKPRKVKAEKLPKGEAYFLRVEKDGIVYDMPVSKTIAFGIAKEAKRHGFDPNKLKGKVFAIIGREWKDAPEEYRKLKEGEEVKTYVVVYKGERVSRETAPEPEEL